MDKCLSGPKGWSAKPYNRQFESDLILNKTIDMKSYNFDAVIIKLCNLSSIKYINK